ncbi:MAG: hypothetical protein PHE73_01965 [Sulfurovaceae bacterium]|nr:hypothetical protein [Sulfurovaceae bacterium]
MKSIKIRILNALLVVDIGIIIFCILAGKRAWFINTQIGFFSSLAVVVASFYSYRKMVEQSIANGAVISSNDELLEKIEDPHGLYDEEESQEAILEETVEEDDKKITTLEALKKSKAFISFYRLGAYLLLALGFLYLHSANILHVPSYLFSIMLPPAIIAIMLFWQSKNSKESM